MEHRLYWGGPIADGERLIVVSGASGQLGNAVRFEVERCGAERACVAPMPSQPSEGRDAHFAWWFLSRSDFDILHPFSLLSRLPVYAVVNCAAYTAVDRAESEPDLAYRINAEGPRSLVAGCQRGERIIHISTDYVFGGQGNTPYHPTSVVMPNGVYAKSKRAGEEAILSYERGMVVRTGWLYSYSQSGFFRRMAQGAQEGASLRVVYDQVGAPTWAHLLARMLIRVVECGVKPGVWHMANAGAVSWFDFACAINRGLGGKARITPIRSCEYPSPVVRPSYSVLDCQPTFTTYGADLCVPWMDSLAECLSLRALT